MVDYPEIPMPEQYDEKEVYAFFGLAAYTAQVLERGVIIFTVVLRIGSIQHVTIELVDELYARFEEKTLGQLLYYARNANVINSDLMEQLNKALHLRNKLIHGFYFSHAEDFLSFQGRKIMIDDLRFMTHVFEDTDKILETLSESLWEKYGITKEYLDREYEKIIMRAKNKYNAT